MTTAAAPPARRLTRRPGGGRVLGVAAAIADHVGIPTWAIRLAFVALAPAGGLGVALYGVYYIVLPVAGRPDRPRVARWLEHVLAVVIGLVCVGIAGESLPQAGVVVPVMLACIGGALIWRQASETDRTRMISLSRHSLVAGSGDRVGRARLAAGAGLVVAGGVLVLARADVTAVRDGTIAVLVTVVGVALITGPWWVRLVGQLSTEREERIRTQERADIAARLHDSVLQTLALIQRNAESPREVLRLARGQERDLRGMLYDSPSTHGQFGERLRAVAAEVEDAYAVSVEVVVVGDVRLDDRLRAAADATREALVNAAKHSGVESMSLYAEIEDREAAVFVKDRGSGFEMADVAEDRQGVRGSIIGRVERHGGTVRLRSVQGTGTEVVIRMPVGNEEDS
ncbi:ATP-binding protein [Jatrophihabitans endophyticus]|uniref:ATP-binding protein n=1 Tax=Jatrophihabitans endophyticus TaxID=1206085 RepID=UPI001F1C6277|nr:ATP-binding protein [Jatrophihabitans endophyticus]